VDAILKALVQPRGAVVKPMVWDAPCSATAKERNNARTNSSY